MAATATSRLRLLKQAYNSNDEAWGGELNAGALDMADEAWGLTQITVGAEVTLTSNNYVSDQSRSFVLECTGAGGFAVITPAVEKPYWVVNDCTADITVKPTGGTAATVRAGTAVFYYAKGTVGRVIDITLDKVKTAAGNVALGGNKLTGVGAATASTDAATLAARLDQFAAPTASVSFGSQKITNLLNGGVGTQDAAPVAQVQSLIASATVNLPAQTGQADKVLRTDGTTPEWSLVETANVADAAVTEAKLADAAVATAKIAAGAVTTAKIPDEAVTLAKLAHIAEATVLLRAAGAGTGDPIAGDVGDLRGIIGNATDALLGLVELATNAEALAGTDTTRAVTSAGLASSQSLAGNGYRQFVGGAILQWGSAVDAANAFTITLPVAFPNNNWAVLAVASDQPASATSLGVHASNRTVSNFVMTTRSITSGTVSNSGNINVSWIAIGN